MTRRSQRAKGKRAEREVETYFRENGFKAERVAFSGAHKDYPGDVKVWHPNGTTFLIEVKIRKDMFKDIYKFVESSHTEGFRFKFELLEVEVTNDFFDLGLTSHKHILKLETLKDKHDYVKTCKKLIKMHEWVKGSDYLVIRQDRKPFLFIKYTRHGDSPIQD